MTTYYFDTYEAGTYIKGKVYAATTSKEAKSFIKSGLVKISEVVAKYYLNDFKVHFSNKAVACLNNGEPYYIQGAAV